MISVLWDALFASYALSIQHDSANPLIFVEITALGSYSDVTREPVCYVMKTQPIDLTLMQSCAQQGIR